MVVLIEFVIRLVNSLIGKINLFDIEIVYTLSYKLIH